MRSRRHAIRLMVLLLPTLLFTACLGPATELKRLDEQQFSDGQVEVSWYRTSSISTIHEHVEVTQGEETRKVAELNSFGLTHIRIQADSIILETPGTGLFYQLDTQAFGYTIVLDTIR